MEKIQNIARTNISELVPYSSARELFAGENCIMMDANENPFGKKLNRYPDPMQKDLKRQIAERENINTENINTENIFLVMAVMKLLTWYFVYSAALLLIMLLQLSLLMVCMKCLQG